MFRQLTSRVSVSPQIAAADVASARAEGFVVIVNNRPDGEAPDQPQGAEIAAAADAAGIAYRYIPMTHGGVTPDMVAEVCAALDAGRTLLYCRSGTRSTMLWALAEASAGADPDELDAAAAAAGYDLSPVMGAVRQLAGAAC